jgi:hypothetical protein
MPEVCRFAVISVNLLQDDNFTKWKDSSFVKCCSTPSRSLARFETRMGGKTAGPSPDSQKKAQPMMLFGRVKQNANATRVVGH